jgi:hypothetical protein
VTTPPQLEVARSLDEVERLRALWSSVRWYRPDADIEFFRTVCEAWPHVVRPHVVVARSAGTEAMLVARLENMPLTTTFGYKAVYSPRVRALVGVHGGVSDPWDDDACRALVTSLDLSLRQGEADMAVLPSIRVGSALWLRASSLGGRHRTGRFNAVETHRRLVLPDTFDDFLRSLSRKTRDGVKRYRRKLEREFGSRLSVEVLDDPADLDRVFAVTEPVAAKTYQRGLGVSLEETSEQRAIVSTALRRGWFRLYVVHVDDTAIAFWPGNAYNGTFFIGTPGYDPAYAEYRVGQFVQMRMIEDLCSDPEVGSVDYGFGDAEYKRRFSNESWDEATVTVFAPTVRAVRVNLVRTAVMGGDRAAKRVLDATGLRDRVRRRWRERLTTHE